MSQTSRKDKIISVSQFVANKEARIYTPYIIKPNGEQGYIVGDRIVSRQAFERQHPVPESLVTGNFHTIHPESVLQTENSF